MLGYPDFNREFILKTDASLRGLGAALSQIDENGKVHVIVYASQTLRPSEKSMHNYSSAKLEQLALKWAVTKKFRDYLLGSEFNVYTDNNPMAYVQTSKLGASQTHWLSKHALLISTSFIDRAKPTRLLMTQASTQSPIINWRVTVTARVMIQSCCHKLPFIISSNQF